MIENWKAFLAEHGIVDTGVIDNNQQAAFESGESNVLSSPSNFGLIKVSGEDAENFLQNQLSNDIRKVTETSHQASAWCTPKGRIIATFRIFKRQDSYYLSVAGDLLEHVIKKLQMYIMMSKVTLEDVSGSIVQFTFSGKNADKALQQILSNEKENANQAIEVPANSEQAILYNSAENSPNGNTNNKVNILRYSDATPRFEIFADIEAAKKLWLACKKDSQIAADNNWHYLNILAGLPHISQASSESWIPQMVNYIAIGGVDFKKGCYPGQEVVARLNYLGKTKRRMYRLLIDTDTLPEINDSIASESDNDAGKILNCALNPENKVEALAVLKIAEAEKGALALANNQAKATLLPLPYAIEE